MKIKNPFDLRDLHVYLGIALVCAGICIVHVPTALAVTGSILIWIGTRRVK